MSEKVTVEYDGPIAALDVIDPQTGREIGSVERGGTIDVPKHVADDLLAREDFRTLETPAQREKREKAERDQAEQEKAAAKAADEARKKVAAEQSKRDKENK